MDRTSSFIAGASGRLDEIIAAELEITKSQAQRLISNQVTIDERMATKNGEKVRAGQRVTFSCIDLDSIPEPPAGEIPYKIVFEDDDLMVIDKPRGLVVHPSPGHIDDTLVNYLVKYSPAIRSIKDKMETDRPGIVHRIDKDTSGLLIVGKSYKALTNLIDELALHEIKREYLCLIHGVPHHHHFKVEAPIGRDLDSRMKMCIDEAHGKRAVTHFELISSRSEHSLLKCRLETGRTHQIRVHLSAIGYPIVGDPLYGLPADKKTCLGGQLLHAYKISFEHPRSKQELTFYAPLDDYFKSYIKKVYS